MGLGLAVASLEEAVFEASYMVSSILIKAFILLAMPCGIMFVMWQGLKRSKSGATEVPPAPSTTTADASVQAALASREDQKWADEYTDRVN